MAAQANFARVVFGLDLPDFTDVRPSDTTRVLKQRIQETSGQSASTYNLSFNNIPLLDGPTLVQQNLIHGSVITATPTRVSCCLRLLLPGCPDHFSR